MADILSLFIPLTKVDEEKRTVYGRATQEVPDSADEIMDYASSAPRFRSWSETAFKRSNGKSRGNLRGMHNPIAAGKLLDMDFNDSEKAIDIGVKVVDDNEWNKVLEGVYTGFSVGGKYARRWPDPKNPRFVRYTAEPQEISLVDAPAVPSATFALVKADGSTEQRHFKAVLPIISSSGESPFGAEGFKLDEPDDVHERILDAHDQANQEPGEIAEVHPTAGNAIKEVPTVAGVPSPGVSASALDNVEPAGIKGAPAEMKKEGEGAAPDNPLLNQLLEVAKAFDATIERLAAFRKADADAKAKIEADLKSRGSSVGIARREGEPMTAPQGAPQDWHRYGDPANWSWSVETPEQAMTKVAEYNDGKGRERYAVNEWHTLGRRMARLASSVSGSQYSYSPSFTKIERKDANRMGTTQTMEKADLMGLLNQVKAALTSAADMVSKDPAAAQDLLMGVLGNLDGAVGDAASSAKTGGESPSFSPSTPVGESMKAISPTSASSPSAPSGSTPRPTPASAPSTSPMSGPSSVKTAEVVPPPASSSSSSSSGVPSGSSDAYAAMKAQFDALQTSMAAMKAALDKLAPAPVEKQDGEGEKPAAPAEPAVKKEEKPAEVKPVAKQEPIGDLAAIIEHAEPEDPYNDIQRAVIAGDLAKAEELAKAAGTSVNAEVMKGVVGSLGRMPGFGVQGRLYQPTTDGAK